MKKLLIVLACALVALASCTKSKEVHPEIGDGNDVIITVGTTGVHVKYARTDHAELNRVVFHYCPADANGNAQQFEAAEMIKRETLFELTLNDLLSDTLYWYYYESFSSGGEASNSSQKTFRTQAFDQPEPPTPPTPPSGAPEGAINGLFTINENGDQVYFSQGNLQYQASTHTWRFAEHQWDYVGGIDHATGQEYGNVFYNSIKCNNSLLSSTYDGWIDLFGWGTSGWNNGNSYFHPWDCSYDIGNDNIGYGYGPTDGTHYSFGLTGEYANSDWGIYNAISNGGNMPSQWRTLTQSEWAYLLESRPTISGVRYAKALVDDIKGVILLPDEWNISIHALSSANDNGLVPFSTNVVTIEEWAVMEANGAVFLPVGGTRSILSYSVGSGTYWLSSAVPNSNDLVYAIDFSDLGPYAESWTSRYLGFSVRLVQDAHN